MYPLSSLSLTGSTTSPYTYCEPAISLLSMSKTFALKRILSHLNFSSLSGSSSSSCPYSSPLISKTFVLNRQVKCNQVNWFPLGQICFWVIILTEQTTSFVLNILQFEQYLWLLWKYFKFCMFCVGIYLCIDLLCCTKRYVLCCNIIVYWFVVLHKKTMSPFGWSKF